MLPRVHIEFRLPKERLSFKFLIDYTPLILELGAATPSPAASADELTARKEGGGVGGGGPLSSRGEASSSPWLEGASDASSAE